jgi:plasmid stabilization system protein ParE
MKIFLSKRAISSFQAIEEQIYSTWGKSVASAFEQRVSDFLDLLEDFPEIGMVEVPEKQIYGSQLTKQTRVFYRIKGEKIIILIFFDGRQDPTKRPK